MAEKYVIMSDHHRGDGSVADSYNKNKLIHKFTLDYYFRNGFTYVENGDSDELWKFDLKDIVYAHKDIFEYLNMFYKENRLVYIEGNHNNKKIAQKQFNNEEIIPNLEIKSKLDLSILNKKIEVRHGHQGEFFEDKFWRIGRFFIRYFWKPLCNLGFADPTKPIKKLKRSDRVDEKLLNYSKENNLIIIAGHTHCPVFSLNYYNDGCVVFPTYLSAIEIENGRVRLVRWFNDVDIENNKIIFKKELIKGSHI